jgi:putative SOS response-associated peptidase YedK
MCGRYMITSHFEAMADLFRAVPGELGPDAARRNVSPTEGVPVVVSHEAERVLERMRWGFLPGWYKSPSGGPLLINARADSIADKPAFRDAVRSRRCLIPADGFYEWQGDKGAKRPWVIRRRGGGMFAFAGVWQLWRGGAAPLATCAIVTCEANAVLAPIHERMPVVIAPEDYALWLGEAGHGAARLMVPAPDALLEAVPADADTQAALKSRDASATTRLSGDQNA